MSSQSSSSDQNDDDSDASSGLHSSDSSYVDENYEFSDSEDERLFGDDLPRFYRTVRPIKSNDPGRWKIDGGWFSWDEFSTPAWSRVGGFLGQNTHITGLRLCGCKLSSEKLEALASGFRNNESLTCLHISNNPIGTDPNDVTDRGFAVFKSFLGGSKFTLKYLNLGRVGLCLGQLRDISLTSHAGKIETLELKHNSFGTEDGNADVNHLVEIFHPSKWPNLEDLCLKGCGIGRNGCLALAEVLGNKKSKLKKLGLDKNLIDDDCLKVLAGALRSNTTLEVLLVETDNDTSPTGYECLNQLLCDTANIQSTLSSNHTLKRIRYDQDMDYFGFDRCLSGRLILANDEKTDRLLGFNHKSATKAAREKVMFVYMMNARSKPFDISPFLKFDVKLVPFFLELLGKDQISVDKEDRLYSIYQFVRHWHIPILFGFPTPERARIESRIAKLEAKNSKLERTIETLVAENARLNAENAHLREQQHVCSKRKRV